MKNDKYNQTSAANVPLSFMERVREREKGRKRGMKHIKEGRELIWKLKERGTRKIQRKAEK